MQENMQDLRSRNVSRFSGTYSARYDFWFLLQIHLTCQMSLNEFLQSSIYTALSSREPISNSRELNEQILVLGSSYECRECSN